MFRIYADKNELSVYEKEPLTSGSVNVYHVQSQFSEDWEGLSRMAVFRAGCVEKTVLLDDSGACDIPWEVLAEPGYRLFVGICGKRGETVVLPTVLADLGLIQEGAPAGTPRLPTPELWQQELDRKGDRLDFTQDGALGLWSGEALLSSVVVEGGGASGAVATEQEVADMLDDVFSAGKT